MKKSFALFFFFCLIANSNASDGLGGEITWQCLTNDRYVFKMKLYRDCSGIPTNFSPRVLNISGNPLPRNSLGISFNSITVRPDSSRYISAIHGDIGPNCSGGPMQLSCVNRDNGSYEQQDYISDTITLIGNPPLNGWEISHNTTGALAFIENLVTRSPSQIKAVFNSNHSNTSVGPCFTSSLQFLEIPTYYFCRKQAISFNFLAYGKDFDSISYHLDNPSSNPSYPPLVYQTAYSFLSPTPDVSFDSLNQAFQLDSRTGQMTFEVHNGTGLLKYLVVIRVDGWRNGSVNSSIYREIPLLLVDCPLDSFSKVNNPPIISPPFYKGGSSFSFKDTITAGSLININLNVMDTDTINGNLQEVSVQLISEHISEDYTISGSCIDPKDSICAYIPLSNATFNPQRGAYEIKRNVLYNGQIRWQTDCSDLSPSGRVRTHYFVVRVQDDLCPVPAVTYKTIEVTVMPPVGNPCPLITSLENPISLKEQLNVFPNPTNGQFTISSIILGGLNLKIYNIQGQLVQEEVLVNRKHQIQLQGEKGLYFITISNQKGEQANFKVVKQ